MSVTRRLQLVASEPASGHLDDGLSSSVRVAFATSDLKHVDQHFGAAQGFTIYAVNEQHALFLEASEFGQLDMDGNEDKLAEKIQVLDGCIAVYCQAIGASAINQLKLKNIQPVKVTPGAEIDDLIGSLQDELRQGPSSWLARAIRHNMAPDPSRFEQMEHEGWEE